MSQASTAAMPESGWLHFAHSADIGVEGFGPTLAGAFEQAAIALTAIVTDPAVVRTEQAVAIRCAAPDEELLFHDWLNALVFEMATRRMVFAGFRVTLSDHSLTAIATGEPIDRGRHRPVTEVKGATLTELSVRQDAAGCWHARCVVDV